MKEEHLAPWQTHNPFEDGIFHEEHEHKQEKQLEQEQKKESQVEVEEKHETFQRKPRKIRFQYQSVSLPKRQKRFVSVLPRVYEKPHHDAQFIVHTKEPKKQQSHPHLPSTIHRNELIIEVPPQQQEPLPKIHPEHPIRHSKYAKLLVDHHEGRYQEDDLSHLMKRMRKNSFETDHTIQHVKKMSAYDEQIIKKCSLKNLQVFERREKVQAHAPKAQKRQVGHVEKHILDKILAKLE